MKKKKKKVMTLPQMPKKRAKKIYQPQEISPEVEAIIDRIALENSKNRRKKFGFLDKEDIYGEVWLICLEVLPKYKEGAGNLENFLRVSVKNRIINRFKTVTKTVKAPCGLCPYHRPEWPNTDCAKFKKAGTMNEPGPRREVCDKWAQYVYAVKRRNNLLNSKERVKEEFADTHTPLEEIISQETIGIIRSKIDDSSILVDFDLLVEGQNIPKYRFQKVRILVEQIIQEEGILG